MRFKSVNTRVKGDHLSESPGGSQTVTARIVIKSNESLAGLVIVHGNQW